MFPNPRPTTSLRWRVLLFLSATLVIASALIAVAIYRFVSDAERDLWRGRQADAGVAATAEVTAFLQRVDTLMNAGATLESDVHVDDIFADIIEQEALIQEALLVSREAEILAHAGEQNVFTNSFTLRQANWFVEALAGERYIGELQYTADNVPYFVLSYPTPGGNVVVARLNMQQVDAVISNFRFGETGRVYLIDPDGWLIGNTDEPVIVNAALQERPEFRNALNAPGMAWTGDYENFAGEQVSGSISQIPGTDWLLAVEVDRTEIAAVSQQAILYLLLGTLLFGAVTILATSRLLGYFVFSPVRNLLEGTHAVEAGNLNYQIEVFNQDEIGTVTQSFNAMTQRLRQREAERSAAEARLAQSERQYRQILDAIGDMILVKGEKSRIVWANKAFRDYYNMTNEELQGMIDAPFNEPDYTQQYVLDDAKVFTSGKPLYIEEPVTRYDGEVRGFNTLKSPIFDENNKVIMTVGVSRDVTERKKAEEERERLIKELKAANRIAQENSRLKSEFLATMSHELRTPLNAIEGFTSIILNKMGGSQYNDKTERYVQRIHTNSRRLLELINDFLDLSRIESGRLELAYMAFSPAKLGEKWQAEIGGLAEKKGLDFDVQVDTALPETMYGDEEAISKVVINLMSNAIKFTEEGGIKVRMSQQADQWQIEVTDTGIGIPPHAREYIFEEFRQVDQTSRRKYGGTGLGLAIVQKITRLMGGIVTLKSEMGKGSTFTVTLPMHLAPITTEEGIKV